VVGADGVPPKGRIGRGCGRTSRPGDTLAVVYDPDGWVPPRGVATGAGVPGLLGDLAPWAAALVAGSTVAAVRSYRLAIPAKAERVLESGGATRC
jgi:hypothetical protein